ncbi:hypothetical protein [Marinospirillum insulare]|uniref:Lipoprotein n=2 Tax=Marinospirillum insulare TaxID=217169 RepID=A0ABQ5ZU21_9GAMM|nr:hypothetical protein [Marinospirillum insulare]GLR63484.1 hypothetical protein GCM10007878_09190 [Marinospirillum insulare]
MNKLWVTLALAGAVLVGGCASLDPVQQEKIRVYEEQKKRESIDRSQRESDSGGRRLDKAIKN